MQKNSKEKLTFKNLMLNHTYVVDRHALLVDRYDLNETRKKIEHKSRRKIWQRLFFWKSTLDTPARDVG